MKSSETRLPDGSLFIPARLLDGERPYQAISASRHGTYWNLVVPDALASRILPPHGPEATGVLDYMLGHGSRLAGLVRGDANSLYHHRVKGASGTNEVYGLNVARFLADNDRPDQLVLSLYGALAAGMTDGTFVSGESATVTPLAGAYYRAMYLPPNSTSNAAFLEALRLMLVHETAIGRPRARLRDPQGMARSRQADPRERRTDELRPALVLARLGGALGPGPAPDPEPGADAIAEPEATTPGRAADHARRARRPGVPALRPGRGDDRSHRPHGQPDAHRALHRLVGSRGARRIGNHPRHA